MDAQLANEVFMGNLAQRAARRGMTTETLARAAAIPTSDITAFLDGTAEPCARARQQLARAVGATPDQLLEDPS